MTELIDTPAGPGAFDLLTIGHSNHPIDRFLALLNDAGIAAVVDVRSLPSSRRYPWFSANRLKDDLAEAGIVYMPMGDVLGGRPRSEALYRDGVADYEAMARTPEFLAGIGRVIAAKERARCCLMCAEREPLECHRCLLVAPALVARGLRIGHILADGSILPHAAIEERLLAGSDDLFAGDRTDRLAQAYSRRANAVAYRPRG
ncbi:MAG TPA: DUF488 domain-containing protein [Xanthobacteraceae bacterium]|nr:DUF488 domain-containing protein [Xanthobacteraceae bacterium]